MNYKYSPEAIFNGLIENESGQVICKETYRIHMPIRFAERGLGQVGIDTFVYGCFPIINEKNEYAVINVAGLIPINPTKTREIVIDDTEYYEFTFDPYQVMIKNIDVVRRDTLMYNVFDEFLFKAKIPWHMDYDRVLKLFDTAQVHAGSNVGQNLEAISIAFSIISRDAKDATKLIRNTAEKRSDFDHGKVTFVPMMSVYFVTDNTANRLVGSYLRDSIKTSLVEKSKKTSKLEEILRS